jgi:hypothetical protein
MIWSGDNLGASDGSPLIRLTINIPAKLSNSEIEKAVTMAASRLKWLMGQRYRQQIEAGVTARYRQPELVS